MPEVLGRDRPPRSARVRRGLDRWFYRNRPKIAVIAAFAVACLLGLVAASVGVHVLGG